jgi:hypothetical protein
MTASNPGQGQAADPDRDQDTDTGATESQTSRPETTPDGKIRYSPDEAGEYGVDPESDKVTQRDGGQDGDAS